MQRTGLIEKDKSIIDTLEVTKVNISAYNAPNHRPIFVAAGQAERTYTSV